MKFPFSILSSELLRDSSWTPAFEGISPESALFVFLLLAAITIAIYMKWARKIGIVWKLIMIGLRLAAFALILALLTKPVARILEEKSVTVKQPVAVMIDASLSMKQKDHRSKPADLARAAIAAGVIDPTADLTEKLPAGAADQLKDLSREELVRKIAENPKLDLWRRIATQADLAFYRFGSTASPLGVATLKEGKNPAKISFPDFKTDAPVTAIGEAVRQVIQEPRGQPLAALILVTDGGNNQGSSPLEAAQIALEKNVPLIIYGVGVTSPPDLEVIEASARNLCFIEERLEVKAKIRFRNWEQKTVTFTLKADGAEVDKVEITLAGQGEKELTFHYIPLAEGEIKLEVSAPIGDDEADKENNAAATTVRVTDRKFAVLLIEQEPRWDFRYLLDYLQRDPLLKAKCVMIHGEPGLERLPDSPFLAALPDSREAFFDYQVLILGDVNPADLGEERMEIIAKWVDTGGGIIFLSGPNFNPSSYEGTPLEPLLPVIPTEAAADPRKPMPLELTDAGRSSPYLRMDPDPKANEKIWRSFPGVRWVTPVAGTKPGADVLLVDPRPSVTGGKGKAPIIAMQSYGSGKCVYFGSDETYRWRSKTGEKYYSILWGQIMQTLSLQLLEAASNRTRLRTDRKTYITGERLVITGNVYKSGYERVEQPTLDGVLTRKTQDGVASTLPMKLINTGKNAYRGEFELKQPGNYTFHTTDDPDAKLAFEVSPDNPETAEAPLDVDMLASMAQAAGGHFIREEDLHRLPELFSATTSKVTNYRKIELFHSKWWLVAMIFLFCLEWTLRRMNRLK